jgi:glucose uptake protein GlcU
MVPQKINRMNTPVYLAVMTPGALATALICWFISGATSHSTWSQRLTAMGIGAVWAVGTYCFAAGIANIGLTLATPIKNTTAVLGTLVGLFALNEWRTSNPIYCIAGSVLVALAATLIGFTRDEATHQKTVTKGVLLSLAAACCYASYLVPMKHTVFAMGYLDYTCWMTLGMIILTWLVTIFTPSEINELKTYSKKDFLWALSGGVAWSFGFITLCASFELIDLSVAWSLSNLNTVPAVLVGILIFKEIDWQKRKRLIIPGLIAAAIGTIFLAMAKG